MSNIKTNDGSILQCWMVNRTKWAERLLATRLKSATWRTNGIYTLLVRWQCWTYHRTHTWLVKSSKSSWLIPADSQRNQGLPVWSSVRTYDHITLTQRFRVCSGKRSPTLLRCTWDKVRDAWREANVSLPDPGYTCENHTQIYDDN